MFHKLYPILTARKMLGWTAKIMELDKTAGLEKTILNFEPLKPPPMIEGFVKHFEVEEQGT